MFEDPTEYTDKETIVTSTDDMASVSTFTTFGNMTWGKTSDHDDGTSSRRKRRRQQEVGVKGRTSVICAVVLIIAIGSIVAYGTGFLGFRAERKGRKESFERGAFITVSKIKDSFDEYVDAASMVHGRCRHRPQFDPSALEMDSNRTVTDYMAWSKDFREDFSELYEYVKASGLKLKAMQFDPNITWQERPTAEAEANTYYSENYPEVDYSGFCGYNGDSTMLESRWWNQSFYFPIHYMEPVLGNEGQIDRDYHSSESTKRAVEAVFRTEAPSLTDRMSIDSESGSVSRCTSGNNKISEDEGPSFGVVLMHPGIRLSKDDETSWPRDLSSIVMCMSDLITRSTDHMTRTTFHENQLMSVYIHDLSHPTKSEPVFMVAARLNQNDTEEDGEGTFSMKLLDEIPLDVFDCTDQLCYQRTITIANREWIVTIIDEQIRDGRRRFFIVITGAIVFAAFFALAIYVLATDRKNRAYATLRAQAAAERNTLVLDNANRAAQTERELNDFLAHEVRNPLSAAMAATQFLRTELERREKSHRGIHVHFEDSSHDLDVDNDEEVVDRDSSIKTISSPRLVQAREDIQVVDHALRFINDLLRNMLDMHRASSGKMQVKFAPVDLLHDVLAPVAGMLHRGGEGRIGRSGKGDEKVKVIVECPENIVVEADVLRLKQVVLNLGRNSVKFINEGFIRLRAEVVQVDDDDPNRFRDEFEQENSEQLDIEFGNNSNKTVRIYVEDSGSGIPMEKRELLFAKYQESLDLLSQGTGIGLHLCKNLVDLMGGEISLDNDYDSGIPGNPGAKFVVDLRSAPLDTSLIGLPMMEEDIDGSIRVNFNFEDGPEGPTLLEQSERTQGTEGESDKMPYLPETLSVLFIDDDRVLRKLFARTIKMVAPEWTVQEAANGETAILLAEEEEFDLIFCDMYMASVEKQLLGTETVAELRTKGVKSRICGLSANDKELEFLEAGSDAFLFKPIPCDAKTLRTTLHRLLYGDKE